MGCLSRTMKSIHYFSLLLIGLQLHCHCLQGHSDDKESHGDRNSPKYRPPPLKHQRHEANNWHKILPSNADFAIRFYKEIASNTTAKNIFFSPLSISTAFALLSLGAKSETLNQIHQGLAFNRSKIEENEIHRGFHQLIHMLNRPNNKAQVNIGNAVFINETFKFEPKFLDDVREFYQSEGFSTNFRNSTAAINQIHDYVQKKTHGKITHIVEKLEQDTVMFLVNYIFFKASWIEPFSHFLTREEDFFVDGNKTVKVDLMYQEGYYKVLHDEDMACWVVEVPYKGDSVAWFILPDEGKLKHVEGALAKEDVSKWPTYFRDEFIYLYIPKFNISASYDLKDLFQRLGVTDVFSSNADLSGITSEHPLNASEASHKAVLNLDESGTEATAITSIVMAGELSLIFPPPPSFKFNRPFLLFIVEKITNSLLFIGKIVNPADKNF
ncbi:alpha-1-antitrypsin-like [Hemicordylus capensis]|uniref:alpha-1-antitrypsin-like n=1 Tax=Hemicordylus capensis TaxID=884348 RepID=UPI0023030A92|nr:alpha-1-antitrypsin-like [Hemicordylus capensis]XP_053142056.1 alpha-1-antitrypsin-like [Hemicordylus capensis]